MPDHSPERRDSETRQSLCEMVAEIRQDTGEIKTALFGPQGQPEMGFVAQTKDRLDNHGGRLGKLETRVLLWAGALSVLVPGLAWAANHYLK